MVLSVVDPLEGAFVILAGSVFVTAGALLGKSEYWQLIVLSFVLISLGVVALLVLSATGGIGGKSGHSIWWGLTILPYPIGWILGLVGIGIMLAEWRKGRSLGSSSTR
jgi:hypothetical protein